jgi:hypothetical protein
VSTVGGVEGECYLGEYDERLFCEVTIPKSYAFTMQYFELFVDHCDGPIYSRRITVPELAGCQESQTQPNPSGCTSGEVIGGITDKSTCEAQGFIWKWVDAYQKCVCP